MESFRAWKAALEERHGKTAVRNAALVSAFLLATLTVALAPGMIEARDPRAASPEADPFADDAVWLAPAPEAERTTLAYAPVEDEGFARTVAAPALTDKLDCLIQPYEIAEVGSALVAVVQDIKVERAEMVMAGQVLAELDSSVEVAAADVAKARADMAASIRAREASLNLGARKRERAKELYGRNVVSEDLRDEAETEEALAAAELARALEMQELSKLEHEQALKRLERRTIRSPFDGVVVDRHKATGEVVKEEPIITVAQINPLRVDVILPAALYGRVAAGQRAEVWPELPGAGVEVAQVTIVDRVIDPGSGTFGVKLDLPNDDLTIPSGTNCQVRFLEGR